MAAPDTSNIPEKIFGAWTPHETAALRDFLGFSCKGTPHRTPQMNRRKLLKMVSASLAFGGLASLEASPKKAAELVNLQDFELAARQRLSRMAYEYIAGGAG